jgi:hypothetical protein
MTKTINGKCGKCGATKIIDGETKFYKKEGEE